MLGPFRAIHQHSLELEKSLTDVANGAASSKAIERTFGIMGTVLTAAGFAIAITGLQNEVQQASDFAAKHEASVISVAEMGLVDPLLIAGGGLFGYAGIEYAAVANGVRRQRLQSEDNGAPGTGNRE